MQAKKSVFSGTIWDMETQRMNESRYATVSCWVTIVALLLRHLLCWLSYRDQKELEGWYEYGYEFQWMFTTVGKEIGLKFVDFKFPPAWSQSLDIVILWMILCEQTTWQRGLDWTASRQPILKPFIFIPHTISVLCNHRERIHSLKQDTQNAFWPSPKVAADPRFCWGIEH